MKIIAHRKNTLAELVATPTHFGIEVDLRTYGGRLILQHEALEPGEDFLTWLNAYRHKTLILNVKEDGLEPFIEQALIRHSIEDYFFLDQPFPTLVKGTKNGQKRSAVRVSEYESITTALALAGQIEWVWVDQFTRFPLSYEDYQNLKTSGFKLCLVSPELQGRDPFKEIPPLAQHLKSQGMDFEAVCTKKPELWNQF